MAAYHGKHRDKAGFGTIEVVVVIVVIGVLIGIILKGQELMSTAQVRATIAQITAIETAVSAFRDKYGALPGDIRDPSSRLPNCSAAPCNTGGDGNGRISDAGLGIWSTTNANEEAVAFSHLAAADLLSGIPGNSATLAYGQMLPEAKVGGGFMIGYTGTNTPSGLSAPLPAGHYLVLNGAQANAGAATGALRPAQAAQIDRALDDGAPDAGTVRVLGTDCTLNDAYNEANEMAACVLYVRILD